ncbi:unnamed protein product [Rotaria magnacalcarata]|uniref:Kinase suppressor of Ras 2 n=1 Tax=Rotaria magnacalcarata TaxID=392030 RepID=A0A815SEL0_9BILA|nr:unnamed protein product [Rotaria magnacalcarata]CAF1488718.1 unnamed protein product [Rotaria magnacalcarata]
MSSDVTLDRENGDAVSPLPSDPTTTLEYSRTISQDLRYFDDALTHAIDQLTTFNSETMSDLSLKYELMRNNESRVIGFFARQLMLLKKEKFNGQNGGFHSEYSKIDRFLIAINFNKKSIEYISQRMTFDNLLNKKTAVNEQILIDAGLTETERKDFHNAHSALKACIEYFSNDGTNDNGRFYWHRETPMSTPSVSKHCLSDAALPTAPATETIRSTSVSSSKSTDFEATANNQSVGQTSPHSRKNNPSHTPPPFRANHLCVNEKGRYEHPSKKSLVDPAIFNTNANSSRNTDLQLPNEGNSSRRNSYGSDSESRLPSGSATPKSPTARSPTLSNSPGGSGQNSDAENDTRIPEAVMYNTSSPILRHRLAHKIQHKFDRTRVFKFSYCDVCRRKVFRGKACIHCKYKCHKECVQHAPANCGLSEILLRRAIDSNDFQNIHANSSPMSRKYPFTPWDNASPTASTPISAPESSVLNPTESAYLKATMCISESLYSTQNDPDSWVVIETTNKNASEIPETQSDTDTNATIQTDTETNLTDSTSTTHSKLVRQMSQSERSHPKCKDLVHTKLFDTNSFDDDETDPEKRSFNLASSLQDWVIVFNNIKMIEEVRRSSGTLMKAHWHGEIAVRIIKPDPKTDPVKFLNLFKNQVFRLRKVRHEHLNLYTGVCIDSPKFAIVSNWIRGINLHEIIHIQNDSIQLNIAVQYAAQIAQAMSYLHEKSINHMSLRTTNIFVQNNRIILTDYGLVPLSKCFRVTDQPAIIAPRGWLSYLAPEIIRKLDPRNEETILQHTPQTDVYAFGTVWYELLFREFPYAKQPPEYIIWRAGNSIKQPLSSVHISKYAKDIINQCWSFAPDDRPDFAMLCKSLSKMPGKRTLVRSPSTPLQYNARLHIETQF